MDRSACHAIWYREAETIKAVAAELTLSPADAELLRLTAAASRPSCCRHRWLNSGRRGRTARLPK